jgi:peptide/nickel transport system ATP-binding protein
VVYVADAADIHSQAQDDVGRAAQSPAAEVVMTVEGLSVTYNTSGPRAVDDVNFELRRGEMLGLVGESGSGKTSTAMAILGLIKPPATVLSGSVRLGGQDLLSVPKRTLRRLRWSEISLVPQGAMNALSPVMRIGKQIEDGIRAHDRQLSRQQLQARIAELLGSVDLAPEVAAMYPHELSGGMKQRACIAMAIALGPTVVVADEPTSALDVVVQKSVARTLADVRERLGVSILLIGHDMALQAQIADRVGVMWKGRLVEIGPVRAIFGDPAHPYTQMLLRSVPSLRESSWHAATDTEGWRESAQTYLDQRLVLRAVGDDHMAAVP